MNTLSKPKHTVKFKGNSLNTPVFGAPIRSPRTPTPTTLCSYTDTFEEEDSAKSPVKYSDSFSDEDLYSDTFVDASATKKSITERIETQIETLIEEEDTDQPDETSYGHHHTYTDTFESMTHAPDAEYSRSTTEDTRTFHSPGTSEVTESATGLDSSSASVYGDKTDYQYGSEDDTFSSGRDFEDEYDYSYTFEATDDITYSKARELEEEQERLRQEEEAALQLLSAEAEEDFTSAMVFNIKQRPYKQYLPEKDTKPKTKVRENKHMVNFKMMKLKLLKEKLKQSENGASEPVVIADNLQRRREKEAKITDYGLESSVLEKLKMRNFMENIKKAANEPVHEPRNCRKCRKHKKEMEAASAEREFLRSKTTALRRNIIEDKIHHHLVKMDSINLIAEISKSLPRPTEDPEVILDRLYQGLSLSKSVTNNRLCNT